jgi:DNA-binding NtrC family response regulator
MKALTEVTPSVGQKFPYPVQFEREEKERPSFTLVFTPDTPMRQIHDKVIQTLLRFTHGNRSQAAQLLRINPRTIRRHLGRKASAEFSPEER